MVFGTLLANSTNARRAGSSETNPNVAILKLEQADHVHPGSLRLPISLAGRSRWARNRQTD
jgi:hypothetical protein